MEVVICEDTKLTFTDAECKILTLWDGSEVSSNTRSASIPDIRVDERLLDDLRSHGVTTTLKVGDTITGFELCIGGPDNSKTGIKVQGPWYIKLAGVDSFLDGAFPGDRGWRNELKLQVVLTPLLQGKIRLEPTEASYPFKNGQTTTILFCVRSGYPWMAIADDMWRTHWPHSSWTTAVTLKIKFSPILEQNKIVHVSPLVNDLLLHDEDFTDTMVMAENQVEIKFHRCVLAVKSPVFEKMFQADMKEARTGTLELPDMSEESVRALKEFLYVGKLRAPEENCVICLELLKAGHKYAIKVLEASTERIFLETDLKWCSVDVALDLFLFVKDLNFPQLKCKAARILKAKRRELKELPRYRDLFKDGNVNVAMELMECLAQDFN